MFGWTCPRCMKVHSPYSAQCDCPATYYTLASSTQFIGTFCNKCRNIVCDCAKYEAAVNNAKRKFEESKTCETCIALNSRCSQHE